MYLPASVTVARDSFLLAYPAFFSIINPLGAAIIFLQAAGDHTAKERADLARLVGIYTFSILMVSIWAGSLLLGFFGITINALRLAGGLFVARGGWVMLQSPEDTEHKRQSQIMQDDGTPVSSPNWRDIAFFPLTMPFTVGPGTMSVAIALSSGDSGRNSLAYGVGISIAAAASAVTVWVAYAYAERLTSMLGVTGTRILSRLAALILMAIGVQIMAGGVIGFMQEAIHSSGLAAH
ncbi:MarC family protein [Acetobacter estunensis]|uniref:MarC family protein n=1 Tax=Acetobacter estunensis TaxID=104097 RepID=UPI001C2D410C|nr:MarC family protein [Acetobacter estunensis]MBV1836390.1 MarC family protein [Acetobacter estunensis]